MDYVFKLMEQRYFRSILEIAIPCLPASNSDFNLYVLLLIDSQTPEKFIVKKFHWKRNLHYELSRLKFLNQFINRVKQIHSKKVNNNETNQEFQGKVRSEPSEMILETNIE